MSEMQCGSMQLESGSPAHRLWSRWSYYPGRARLLLRADPVTGRAELISAHGTEKTWEDPLAALGWMASQCRAEPAAGPPFKGGWIGYLSYELGRWIEPAVGTTPPADQFPLFEFTFHSISAAVDQITGRHFLTEVHDIQSGGYIELPRQFVIDHRPATSNFTRQGYCRAVQQCLEYIAAGDIYQVNLSQRFTLGLSAAADEIYRRLRARWPAWFGAYLEYGDHALLCNSPELFFRIRHARDGRRIVTRPVKGTRPAERGMKQQLLASSKDQAELNMIVDLERNDLGRLCQIGSVRVLEPRVIEAHPGVYHGVATIEGMLPPQVGFVDVLRAMFPGGSVTGAPKIRAMQIIAQLERTARGPYCGAIGFLSVDGQADFNIAIRTMIVERDRIHIPVGGGIVADSDPAAEYEETLVKAKPMFEVLGV